MMKTTATFRFIIAAMTAISVFSSCRKEPVVGESASGTTDGARVISVQFDNSTKVAFGDDGLTPKFVNNDKIRVSNSQKSEECTVTVSGTSATFTTTLSGELTAVYPADAAVLASEETDAPIASSNNFKVPSSQTGKVEDAIIAKAEIAAESSSATFNGVTALFEITPPSTAKKITVTSLKKVESGSRTGTAADINTEDTGKTVITVGDGSTDLPGTIYVALVPGVNLTDLSFDAGETVGLKGIPTSKLGTGSDETAAKTKYTIDGTNWHPYVTINGLKWATMNIGANSPTDAGTYFSWGSVEKVYSLSGTTFTFQTDNPDATRYTGTWTQGSGFADCNTPYFNGSSYTKYTGTSGDKKTVLELADDAAYVNWGGPWRMPIGGASGEFQALHTAAPGVWTTESGVKGCKFTETSTGKTLFFLAAGCGDGTVLNDAGVRGLYWSSSLTDDTVIAYYLFFSGYNVYPGGAYYRCRGSSVRPVSD